MIREYLSPGARQKNISANYLSIGTFENKKVGYMFEVKTFRQNLRLIQYHKESRMVNS